MLNGPATGVPLLPLLPLSASGLLFPVAPLVLWVVGAVFGLTGTAGTVGGRARALVRAAYVCGAVGGSLGLAGAAAALAVPGPALRWDLTPPAAASSGVTERAVAAGALTFAADPLATLFGALLCGVVAAVSVYALGYRPGHDAPDGAHGGAATGHVPSEGHLAAGYHVFFVAAILLVFLADSVLAFLLAWEAMSLTSFFLVLYDHEDRTVRRAGFVYLVMTHAGTAFLIAAYLLLAGHGGGFTFAALRAAGQASGPAPWKTAAFLLALVGFGTKAGLVPLHIWLPRAHPAAPTHVSALMSGVMVKTGVYGLLRVGWDLLGALQSAPGQPGGLAGAGAHLQAPALPVWCGWLLLVLGIASAVLGVLNALMERDLKRLLAYSTVENVGIVFVGLGASLVLSAAGLPGPAALALGAALLHVLNHAAFKSLLFLGAGAMLQGAHTKDLEEMGGLIRRMPWTAATVLVGAAAIAGLPPLNGFPGEWLTLQALVALAAGASGSWGAAVATAAVGIAALLGLAAALAAARFVKVFGGAFLALPRHRHAAEATEVPLSMRWGMGALAAACIAMGLLAGTVLGAVAAGAAPLLPVTAGPVLGAAAAGPIAGMALTAVPNADAEPNGAVAQGPVLAPLVLLAGLAVAAGLATALRLGLSHGTHVRPAPTWACGMRLEPRMEYTPQSFADPLRLIFSWAIQPFRHTEIDHAPGAPPYFVRALRYRAGVRPPIEHAVYQRSVRLLLGAARRVQRVQTGSLRLYLAYMLVALAALLVWGR